MNFSFTNNEAEVVRLLAKHGPLVAAVDATSWQDYLGGIIQFHCESNHNHAVQIVGYDLTGNSLYQLNYVIIFILIFKVKFLITSSGTLGEHHMELTVIFI